MSGVLHFATQSADVDVYGARAPEVVVAPHAAQERLPGVHTARVGGQEAQKLVLLVGQDDPPAGHGGLVTLLVDYQVANSYHLSAVPTAGLPEDTAYPGPQLRVSEGAEYEVLHRQSGIQQGAVLLGDYGQDGKMHLLTSLEEGAQVLRRHQSNVHHYEVRGLFEGYLLYNQGLLVQGQSESFLLQRPEAAPLVLWSQQKNASA